MLTELEEQACSYIDKNKEDLFALATYLHENPELGLSEYKAVDAIKNFFEKHKWSVEIGLGQVPELKTAMRIKSPVENSSFNMAFLGEYDALPGLGHGCGHNLIATMSVGAALGFAHAVGDSAATTFLGCPAEETVGGKVFMAEEGLFKGYNGALIMHPGGRNEIGGSSLASHPLEVHFIGRAAHVASLTDKGINALEAASEMLLSMRKLKVSFPEKYGVIIGTIFTESGDAPNIIPDSATLHMTVRAKRVAFLEEVVLPAVKKKALAIAEKYGATVEMHHYEPLFKDMQQDKTLQDIVEQVMIEFGETPKHLPDDEADGSTDVGNVTYEIPAVQPTITIGTGIEAHTPAFACAAGSAYGKEQAIKGAKIMAVAALRYFDSNTVSR